MARLPEPGGDAGNWGEILNDFLRQEHKDDGSLKPDASLAAKANTSTVDALVSRLDVEHNADGTLKPSGSLAEYRIRDAKVSSGMRVIGLGDSNCIATQNQGTYEWSSLSWFNQAVLQSNGRLVWCRNAGVWGDTIAGVQARLEADVIAYQPDVVLLNIGTNDCTSWDFNLATAATGYHDIVNRLLRVGIRVVVCTLLPRNDSAVNRLHSDAFNAWLWSYAHAHALDFVDMTTPLIDSTSGQYLAGYNKDVLHLSSMGARVVGKAIIDQIGHFLPAASLPLARYKGEAANLIVNGVFEGDSNADGVADNWLAGMTGGAFSLVTDSGIAGNWQQVVTSSGQPSISQSVSAGWNLGDTLRFTGRVETQGLSGSIGAYVFVDFGNGNRIAPLFNYSTDASVEFSLAREVPAGTTACTIRAYIGNGGTGTIRIAQLRLTNESALPAV